MPDHEEQARADQWRLTVAPDGRSATVSTPPGVMLSKLASGSVELRLAETPAPVDALDPVAPPDWTVELAEQILRRAQSKGSVFLRALVDEGGTATAERLRERTRYQALNHASQTLTAAARQVLARHQPGGAHWRHFFTARPHPHQRSARVYDYHLPDELVPIFDQALTRIGQ